VDRRRLSAVQFAEDGDAATTLTVAELAEQYSGVAFFIKPEFKFEQHTPAAGRDKFDHWFWGVVRQNWRLYGYSLAPRQAVFFIYSPHLGEHTAWDLPSSFRVVN
jgi:ABC-type bacteriocin/lantibiotic exporter with double-glycine peptidase domain